MRSFENFNLYTKSEFFLFIKHLDNTLSISRPEETSLTSSTMKYSLIEIVLQ